MSLDSLRNLAKAQDANLPIECNNSCKRVIDLQWFVDISFYHRPAAYSICPVQTPTLRFGGIRTRAEHRAWH